MLIADKQSGGDHQGNSCTKVLLQEKENEKLILFSFDYFPSKPFNLQQPFPQNKEIKVVSFLLQKAFINPRKLCINVFHRFCTIIFVYLHFNFLKIMCLFLFWKSISLNSVIDPEK